MTYRRLSVLATLVIMSASPGAAQDYTFEDLLLLFEDQRNAFRAQAEGKCGGSDLGECRGLKIVTLESPEDAAGNDDVAVTGQGSFQTAAADTGDGQLSYASFAPEAQVNFRINFEFDSASLSETEKPKLDLVCEVMKASDIELFRIVGHTDASGPEAYNNRLSLMRAEEVARYLVESCGVESGRLETFGLGERFPFDPADPAADANRRVEFQALT